MTAAALTPRETSVLQAITAHIAEHGYPPTLQEVGAASGLSSSASVSHVLGRLVAKGAISRVPGSPRAIRVLDPGGVAS